MADDGKKTKPKTHQDWDTWASSVDVDLDDHDGSIDANFRQQQLLQALDREFAPEQRHGRDDLTYQERDKLNDFVDSNFAIPGRQQPVDAKACAQCKAPGTTFKTKPCPFCQRVYYCIDEGGKTESKCAVLHRAVHAEQCKGAAEGRDEKMVDDMWDRWFRPDPERFRMLCDFVRFHMPNRNDKSRKGVKLSDLRDLVILVDANNGSADNKAFSFQWLSADVIFRKVTKDVKFQDDFVKRDRSREFYAILAWNNMQGLRKFTLPTDHRSELCKEANINGVPATIDADFCDYCSRKPHEQKKLRKKLKAIAVDAVEKS